MIKTLAERFQVDIGGIHAGKKLAARGVVFDWAIATDDGVPPLFNELKVQEDIGFIARVRDDHPDDLQRWYVREEYLVQDAYCTECGSIGHAQWSHWDVNECALKYLYVRCRYSRRKFTDHHP